MDDDNLAVRMTRHGRQVDSAVINRAELWVTTAETGIVVDLEKFVAAFALIALSTKYVDVTGLAGTTSWRALGLHDVASTDFHDEADDSHAIVLLSHAVNLDPDSHPASLMLEHRRYRYGVKFEELSRYANWLQQEAEHVELKHKPKERPAWWFGRQPTSAPVRPTEDPVDADFSLHYRRVLLNYVVIVQNLSSIADRGVNSPGSAGGSLTDHKSRARDWASRLVQLTRGSPDGDRASETGEVGSLQADIGRVAAVGYVALGGVETNAEIAPLIKEAQISASPWVRYDLGCMRFAQSQISAGSLRGASLRNEALEHLEYANVDQRIRKFMPNDPMLTALHSDHRFQKLTHDPRTDYWELESFTPFRDKLAKLGVLSPLYLTAFERDEAAFSVFLGASRLQALAILGISGLSNRAESLAHALGSDPLFGAYKVEVVAAIVREGLLSSTSIRGLGEIELELLRLRVFTTLRERYPDESFDRGLVARWVDFLSG